jgi:hypothetical protein
VFFYSAGSLYGPSSKTHPISLVLGQAVGPPFIKVACANLMSNCQSLTNFLRRRLVIVNASSVFGAKCQCLEKLLAIHCFVCLYELYTKTQTHPIVFPLHPNKKKKNLGKMATYSIVLGNPVPKSPASSVHPTGKPPLLQFFIFVSVLVWVFAAFNM